MITELGSSSYNDPVPDRIGLSDWHRLFKEIPETFIEEYRYFRDVGKTEWNTYLFPPTTFKIYGSRYLRKLVFDNSLASLRLWGFMLSESERLFRAKQAGKKVIAVMGDLGSIPPLVYSFSNVIPFYPDCYWWTPFLNESTILFEEAERLGIGEDCCFVRAALGAFSKLAYFPQPDFIIAATGATCDDMAAVMQGTGRLGNSIHWFEIPHRRSRTEWSVKEVFNETASGNVEHPLHLKEFISDEFKRLIPELEKVSGQSFSETNLEKSISKINELRYLINEIRELTFAAEINPLPALEIMNVEFAGLSAYSDLDEALRVLHHMRDTVKYRVETGQGTGKSDQTRVMWVTPPADPILLNNLEDIGGRLSGTEFLINQSRHQLTGDDDPIAKLADGMLNGSLMGTSGARAEEVIRQSEKYKAEGVIISNIFASSHCSCETGIIRKRLKEKLNIPVLAFDVVGPGKNKKQSQIFNRMNAFMEIASEKRRQYA